MHERAKRILFKKLKLVGKARFGNKEAEEQRI
jgi:hypothetical protein